MADEATDGTTVDTAAVTDALSSMLSGVESPSEDSSFDQGSDDTAQQEQTPAQDNLLGPDPDVSDLSPEVAALVNQRVLELRQGFTKRTTELADANRILEAAGGNPEELLQSYEFTRMLTEDSAEAQEARDRLYQALASEYDGQQATPQVEQNQAPSEDPFSEYDLPDEIRNALASIPQLQQQMQEITSAREQFAQEQAHQQYLNDVVNDLTTKYNTITEEYPDLKGSSAEEAQAIEEEVFALAASTDGNLLQAVDLYRRIEARAQAKLYQGSANVPGGMAAAPAGGGHSTEPVEIETMKDAGAASKEYLERFFANQ